MSKFKEASENLALCRNCEGEFSPEPDT